MAVLCPGDASAGRVSPALLVLQGQDQGNGRACPRVHEEGENKAVQWAGTVKALQHEQIALVCHQQDGSKAAPDNHSLHSKSSDKEL